DQRRGMQEVGDGSALGRGQRPWRGGPPRRPRPRAPTPIGRGDRHPGRPTERGHAQLRPDGADRRHQDFSFSNGVPSNAATFFCTSTSASARSARFFHFAISRSCSVIFLSRVSGGAAFGPRFLGASASNSPRSRAARQVVRCEEYSPSRRSSAPIAPGVVHRSASRTMRRLYSAVKRRRCGLATTSVSAVVTTGGSPGTPAAKTPVALPAPSVSPAPSSTFLFSTTFIHHCLPALYSKLSLPDYLTLIGREGTGKRVQRRHGADVPMHKQRESRVAVNSASGRGNSAVPESNPRSRLSV